MTLRSLSAVGTREVPAATYNGGGVAKMANAGYTWHLENGQASPKRLQSRRGRYAGSNPDPVPMQVRILPPPLRNAVQSCPMTTGLASRPRAGEDRKGAGTKATMRSRGPTGICSDRLYPAPGPTYRKESHGTNNRQNRSRLEMPQVWF